MFLPPFNIQLTPGMVGNKGAENGRKGANSNESNESSEVWVIFWTTTTDSQGISCGEFQIQIFLTQAENGVDFGT